MGSLRELPALRQNLLAHALHYEHLADEAPLFTVALFGKTCARAESVDWRLPLRDEYTLEYTCRILQDMGGTIYYAPNVSHANAQRVPRGALRHAIITKPPVTVFGNKDECGDMILLEAGEGVVLNPAGCGLILAEYDMACAAHAGWRSLIDDDRILNRAKAWRLRETVVETIVRNLRAQRHPRGMRVWLRSFMRPEQLHFPLEGVWAEVNAARLSYVTNRWGTQCVVQNTTGYGIDMPKLVAAQFEEWGVRNIDFDHAYLPKEGAWQSGEAGAPRNLLVVVRR